MIAGVRPNHTVTHVYVFKSLMENGQLISKMLYTASINPIIRDWYYKMWLKSIYGPECPEYSGNSPKIVSNMVENRVNVLEL